jgi:uncharacterized coiled-coil protein SlyX
MEKRESFWIAHPRCPMMKAVLKTLAISFGGGLALGAGIRLTQGPARTRREEPAVDLHPLLTRLQNVEHRIVEMETVTPAVSENTLAAFESRVAAQLGDVEQLRGEVDVIDRRVGKLDAQIPALVQSAVEVRFDQVQHKLHQDFEETQNRSMEVFVETLQSRMLEIPAIVQSTVDVRFNEVQQKLQHDFEEAQSRSMAAFVDTLQSRVVDRINTLETNLVDQSDAIGKLRDTSLRTDESLQKMLVGIERLVDQSRAQQPEPAPQAPAPGPAPEPPVVVLQKEPGEPEKIAAHLTQVRDGAVERIDESKPVAEPQPVLVAKATLAPVEAAPAPVPAPTPVAAEPPAAEVVAPDDALQSDES